MNENVCGRSTGETYSYVGVSERLLTAKEYWVGGFSQITAQSHQYAERIGREVSADRVGMV